MKRAAQLAIVLIISITFAFIAGCQEQNASNAKQNRLFADENIQLKKQLEQKDAEIQKQKELLDKCTEEKTFLKDQSRKNTRELLEKIMGKAGEKDKTLQQENESLKTQVAELKKQLEQGGKTAQ